jgi:Tfp pilus assembly protein PilZ
MVPPPPDATTDDGGSDRRRYLRYSVQCQCWLESEQATAYGPTADLALGGVFLRTAVPLAQGDQVEVALSIGRKGIAVRAQGVVTRSVRARQGRRHGVGVEFVRILYGGQRLLNFLGRAQKPAFPTRMTTRPTSPSKRP